MRTLIPQAPLVRVIATAAMLILMSMPIGAIAAQPTDAEAAQQVAGQLGISANDIKIISITYAGTRQVGDQIIEEWDIQYELRGRGSPLPNEPNDSSQPGGGNMWWPGQAKDPHASPNSDRTSPDARTLEVASSAGSNTERPASGSTWDWRVILLVIGSLVAIGGATLAGTASAALFWWKFSASRVLATRGTHLDGIRGRQCARPAGDGGPRTCR